MHMFGRSYLVIQILLVTAAMLVAPEVQSQKLNKARQGVRKGNNGTTPKQGSSSTGQPGGNGAPDSGSSGGSGCQPDDHGCIEEAGAGDITAMIIGFAFHLPHVLIESKADYSSSGYFYRYPYQKDEDGYMTFTADRSSKITPKRTTDGDLLIGAGEDVTKPARSRPVALRLAAEYSHDLESIHKPAAYLLFSTRWRVGLEAGFTYFREKLSYEPYNDNLGVGDINLIYRFAQSDHIQMRSGLGARMMYDEEQVDAGFNFTYGIDIFPVYPLVVSASIDLGNLGKVLALHGRGHLGAIFWGVELYIGWDGMLIGDVGIHGPMGGIRVWF